MNDPTKKILLEVADGPERLVLYTSEEQAVVDFANQCPALYLQASLNGASITLGPFHLLCDPMVAALDTSIKDARALGVPQLQQRVAELEAGFAHVEVLIENAIEYAGPAPMSYTDQHPELAGSLREVLQAIGEGKSGMVLRATLAGKDAEIARLESRAYHFAELKEQLEAVLAKHSI